MKTYIEATPVQSYTENFLHPLIDACVSSASEDELREILAYDELMGVFDGSPYSYGFGHRPVQSFK